MAYNGRMKMPLFAALAASPAFACAQLSYSNDFQSTVGGEWSSNSRITVRAATDRIGLGDFLNQSVTLTLDGFQPGVPASLKFDLYILNSWDGDNTTFGPDRFTTAIAGTNVVDATFTVLDEFAYTQSYSAATPLGGGPFAAYNDADERDTLDNNAFAYGNAVYKFGGGKNPGFAFVPLTRTVVFSFSASGLDGSGTESWAIDNVALTQPVPEPASLAALALGALALVKRRRFSRIER